MGISNTYGFPGYSGVNGVSSFARPAAPAANGLEQKLSDIAKKNNMQSLTVRPLGTSESYGFNKDQSPASSASTLKTELAVTALDKMKAEGLSLDTQIDVPREILGKEDKATFPQQITLRDALNGALKNSSNTRANVLAYFIGRQGEQDRDFKKIAANTTQALHQEGFTGSRFSSYFNSDGPLGSKSNPHNQITGQDSTEAMNRLFTGTGEGHQVARDALQAAKSPEVKIPNRVADKYGWNDKVIGDTAVMDIGGKKYIVSGFINKSGSVDDKKGFASLNQSLQDVATTLNTSA